MEYLVWQLVQSAIAKCSKLVNRKWSKCIQVRLFYRVLNAGARGCFDISKIYSPHPQPESGLPNLTKMDVWEISLGAIRGMRNTLKISLRVSGVELASVRLGAEIKAGLQ